jgi:hypothetical protein
MNEEEPEYYGPDPDDFYDIMRDDTSEEFISDINKIHKLYVEEITSPNLMYYKNNSQRFWEHLKSHCEYELKKIRH